jgi:hypothetical protein
VEGYPLEGCKERSPIRRAARFQIGTVLFSSNSSSELVSTLASPLRLDYRVWRNLVLFSRCLFMMAYYGLVHPAALLLDQTENTNAQLWTWKVQG